MNKKQMEIIFGMIGYTGWCALGVNRGVNSYKYHLNKNKSNDSYLYMSSTIHGICGAFLYATPFLFPYFMYKELYRLEINIRDLEKEKKSTFYNDII